MGATPPARLSAYAQQLADELEKASGSRLRAAYLHGSGALGGWMPGRSDVDMLFVAADAIPRAAVDAMARTLLAAADDGPGRGLECSIVAEAHARHPAPPWPFLAHVVAGPGQQTRIVHPSGRTPGDPDLLMHYAVCREAGWRVSGPPAARLIGVVSRSAVLGYLAEELRWGLEHAPEAYAVLNACRAMVYLTDQEIVSKIAGGEAALSRGTGPADVIRRALGQQQGREPAQPPTADAAGFVLAVAAALHTAALRTAARAAD